MSTDAPAAGYECVLVDFIAVRQPCLSPIPYCSHQQHA